MLEERVNGKLSKERQKLLGLLLKDRAGRASGPPATITRLSDGRTSLPLSFSQERLWFLQQLMPESAAFNIFKAVRLEGRLHIDVLERTLTEIHRRHESLRTAFVMVDDKPQQIIHPPEPIRLNIEGLESIHPSQWEDEVKNRIEAEKMTPFDLSTGPLLRCRLLRLDREHHVMLLNMHHIISDGWSIGLLLKEFVLRYEAFRRGKPSPLPSLKIQYGDYAVWQRQQMETREWRQQLAYWKTRLRDVPSTVELISDRKRPVHPSFSGGLESIVLSAALREKLHQFSRQRETTLFMTLLAGLQALLYRYTGQEDFAIGTPIANRRYSETEDLIGVFINTLVMRADCSGSPTALELIERTRQACVEAYANQDVPFEKIVEELNPKRILNEQPLFQIMFLLRNEPFELLKCSDLEMSFLSSSNRTVTSDLALSVHDTNGELSCWMEYSSELFDQHTIRRTLVHFRNLLETMVTSPEKPITDLSYVNESEKRQVIVEWNSTQQDVKGGEQSLAALLTNTAHSAVHNTAVIHETRHLTYGELNARSNQFAHYLRERGVKPEVRVGICMGRSPELLVAMIGILKAGGVYVPMDPAYPSERLEYILQDSRAEALVTEKKLKDRLAEIFVNVIYVDETWEELGQKSPADPDNEILPGNLAYLMYTSGSTGRPKGVGITHGNVVAFIRWAQQVFSEEELSGVLASTSVCFDLSIFEIFVPLSSGGTVVLAENALQLPNLCEKDRVCLLNTVPSAAQELLRQNGIPPQVRTINLAGEALAASLVDDLYDRCGVERVIDLYGPTENTTYSTYEVRRRGGPETIGRPIANTQVYILDEQMQPAPPGVQGEIYIGGLGTSRGYWKQPVLTAEKYLPDPFSRGGGERLYRTGDLGRYSNDGRIEYRGRSDQQVKIRGYRIELPEIEAVLRSHPKVQAAAVVLKTGADAGKLVVGYVAGKNREPLQARALREFLRTKLPDYMIPGFIVPLDELPLTPNGKVDRKKLREWEFDDTRLQAQEQPYVSPETELEELLAGIWCEVLGLSRVGVLHNFFDLGGHSLLATQMFSRLCSKLKVDLPVRMVFEFPAIRDLAAAIQEGQASGVELVPCHQPAMTSRAGEELDTLLDEISNLSEEEARSLLADESV